MPDILTAAIMDAEVATRQAREAGLILQRANPLNAETPMSALNGAEITPNAQFYVRNHFPVPALDDAGWQLTVTGSVEQIYYRAGEMVPAGKPVVALLPPGNLKLRFFVGEAVLPRIKLGDSVKVQCDGCAGDLTATVSFIARASEFTPPVIYSTEERAKLVFMVEARPQRPDELRVGQPVSIALAADEARP